MKKYTVTVIKTDTYSADIEVEAENEDEALEVATEAALNEEGHNWRYWESEFDTIQVEEV
jgi:hypothetical protein